MKPYVVMSTSATGKDITRIFALTNDTLFSNEKVDIIFLNKVHNSFSMCYELSKPGWKGENFLHVSRGTFNDPEDQVFSVIDKYRVYLIHPYYITLMRVLGIMPYGYSWDGKTYCEMPELLSPIN